MTKILAKNIQGLSAKEGKTKHIIGIKCNTQITKKIKTKKQNHVSFIKKKQKEVILN